MSVSEPSREDTVSCLLDKGASNAGVGGLVARREDVSRGVVETGLFLAWRAVAGCDGCVGPRKCCELLASSIKVLVRPTWAMAAEG